MNAVTGTLHVLRHFCGVLAIHHTSKPPQQGSNFSSRTVGENLRGSSVLGGAANVTIMSRPAGKHRVRLAFEIKTPQDEEPEALTVEWDRETGLWGAEPPLTEDTVLAAVARQPGITRHGLVDRLARRKQDVLSIIQTLLDQGILYEHQQGRGKGLYSATGL